MRQSGPTGCARSSNAPTSWPLRVTNASATMSSSGHVFFAFSLASISLRAGCSSSGPGGTKRDRRAITRPFGRSGAGTAPVRGAVDLAPGDAQAPFVVRARGAHLEVVQHPPEDVDASGLEVDAVELERRAPSTASSGADFADSLRVEREPLVDVEVARMSPRTQMPGRSAAPPRATALPSSSSARSTVPVPLARSGAR